MDLTIFCVGIIFGLMGVTIYSLCDTILHAFALLFTQALRRLHVLLHGLI
jgi:hypothetical protein